jgi:peptidyl-prolyl cis-trans isomerase C
MIHKKHIPLIIQLLIIGLFSTACNNGTSSNTPEISNPKPSETGVVVDATATTSPFAPSTLDPGIPMAATVNGHGIPLDEFQTELAMSQAASGTGLVTYAEEDVLQNLIDEVLLSQGAAEAGFIPDEALIQTRIEELNMGEQPLEDWISTYGYTLESFKQALSRSIAAAWMRDQIISKVPSTAEQVHARQILLYNSDDAESAFAQLQTGSDFATLAAQYDPLTSGELGWFPRGYLTMPELDDPVFSLQPGEYTDIIQTDLGYHIIQVIERDPQRDLSPGAFQSAQVQAVQNWLVRRRSQSDIQILWP